MQRRYNLAPLILAIVIVLGLTPLMVVVDAQAQIGFISDRVWDDLQWEIYVMDTNGGNLRNLTNTPGDDEYPSWSPDGKQIVFTSNRDDRDGNRRQIYVMDADGADQRTYLTVTLMTGIPHGLPMANGLPLYLRGVRAMKST